MNTRDKIIETAIRLFNEKGTRAVTTNHIAAAAEISAGNLYYHFRNKEAIIHAIFRQMDAYGREEHRRLQDESTPGTIETMEKSFIMIQKFNWRFRFFKRELTSLVNADPALKEDFVRTHREMLALVRSNIDRSIEHGLLLTLPKEDRQLLAETIWLVTLFWPNYLEVSGEEVNEASLRRGSDLLRRILLPYVVQRPKRRRRRG
jgi:AcrR family transcriptional regulator